MPAINPYLAFDNECEAAFELYKSVFGGEYMSKSKFKDVPDQGLAPEDAERIMHVSLPIGDTVLMGSDSPSNMGGVNKGNNISVSVNADSKEQAEKFFNGLSKGGNVIMPMENTFWGAYFGMCTDKFGINWMVNYDLQK